MSPAFAQNLLLALAAAVAGTAVAYFATPYMGIATFAYGLMAAGLMRRRQRRVHRAFMATALALDTGLVLTLELQRGATATAASLALSPLQSAHVLASTLAVLTYLPIVVLGIVLWSEESPRVRQLHRILGYLAFVLRTLGFLLMFSLLSRQPL